MHWCELSAVGSGRNRFRVQLTNETVSLRPSSSSGSFRWYQSCGRLGEYFSIAHAVLRRFYLLSVMHLAWGRIYSRSLDRLHLQIQ